MIQMKQDIALHTDMLALKAKELSHIRHTAAPDIAKELQNSIRHLNMENAKLQIVIDKIGQNKNIQSDAITAYTESGQDSVEILFSANPGSNPKPLVNVASGGELSRILLGIKQVLVNMVEPKLLILDEIDAGIGGKTAEMVADCIAAIAMRQPVLCITHLAQIAAVANTHIAVTKESDSKTSVNLKMLTYNERITELARMLSGSITPTALEHAKEIIKT